MNHNEMDTALATHLGHTVLGLAYVYEDEMSCINIRPMSEIEARYPDSDEQKVVRHRNLRPVMLTEDAIDCVVGVSDQHNGELIYGHDEACLEPVEPYSTSTTCSSNLLVQLGQKHPEFTAEVNYRPWLKGQPWYAVLDTKDNHGTSDGDSFADAVAKAALFMISVRPGVSEDETPTAPAVTTAEEPTLAAPHCAHPVQDKAPAIVLIFFLTMISLAIGVTALIKISNIPAFVTIEQKVVPADGPK